MDLLATNRPVLLRSAMRKGISWLVLFGCAVWAAPAAPSAQAEDLTEYQVKAAFLFTFAKFVEWPDKAFADAQAPIVFGIVGDDPFGENLARVVAGQQVRGRRTVIRKYRFGEDLRTCQVLFVSASERLRVPQILASLQGASILTVGDVDRFVDAGGVVQFVLEEDRVRFLINPEAASRARLQVSSKLLALAHVVASSEAHGVN